MAKKTTIWRPDTCDCEIFYEWDDAVSTDQRMHTPVETLVDNEGKTRNMKKCAYHNVPDIQEHYNKVLDENQRKNYALEEIKKAFPILAVDIVEDGQITGSRLKKGIVRWSFDNQRMLVLKIPDLNVSQKASIQVILSNRFGSGKVIIS